jgi:transposase-like protein
VDDQDEGSTLGKGVHMASSERKHRRSFSEQYKADTIALIRTSGKSIPQVCRDLDLKTV